LLVTALRTNTEDTTAELTAGTAAYVVGDVITMTDQSTVTVDAVDLNGDVTDFTVTTASGIGFQPATILSQESTELVQPPEPENYRHPATAVGFSITPDTANEDDFGSPLTFEVVTTSAGPPGPIATFTIEEQGDYFVYPTSPFATTSGGGGPPDSFILAQTGDDDGLNVEPLQFTSTADQTSWVERAMTETDETDANPRYGIAYDGSGTWVSAGEGDLQGDFVTSLESTFRSTDDGVTWTPVTTSVQREMRDVAYGAGVFVAVGEEGAIETSPDGATSNWTTRTSGVAPNWLYAVHWTGSTFIAVGQGDILTSADGITWAATATTPAGSPWFNSVDSNGSRWFVGTDRFSTVDSTVYYSDNSGATWSAPTGANLDPQDIVGIANNGAGTVVAIGQDGGALLSTDNGASYSDISSSIDGTYLNAIIYDYGATSAIGFVIGGWTALNIQAFIVTSLDGSTWTTRVNTSSTANGVLSLSGKNLVPVTGGADATFTLTSLSYRIHHDTQQNQTAHRNADSASTTLTAMIGLTDNLIGVTDETLLFNTDPTRSAPQIAWIGTERIIYHGANVSSNELTGVIRGTNGTHAQTHQVGAKIFDGGEDQVIPTPNVYWVNSATTSYQTAPANAGTWTYNGNGEVHFSDLVQTEMVTSIALNSGGGTYNVGDTLTVVGGTFTTAATVLVTAEVGNVITQVQVIDPGEYTVFPGVGAATTVAPAGGTLATIDYSGPVIEVGDTLRVVTAFNPQIENSYFIKGLIGKGEVSIITVDVSGTGYSVGDTLSIAQLEGALGVGTTDAVLEVGGVFGDGSILYVSIIDRGTGYIQGGASWTVTDAGDANAQISVTTNVEGVVLAQGGTILDEFGRISLNFGVVWELDRALPGGLNAATTAAATFIQLEEGNVLPISLSP